MSSSYAELGYDERRGPSDYSVAGGMFMPQSVSRQATFQQWNASSFRRVCSNENIETYGLIAYSLPRAESSVVRALECVAGNNNSSQKRLSRKYKPVALREREPRRPQHKAQLRALPTRVLGH